MFKWMQKNENFLFKKTFLGLTVVKIEKMVKNAKFGFIEINLSELQ